jgi:hypothetical protein
MDGNMENDVGLNGRTCSLMTSSAASSAVVTVLPALLSCETVTGLLILAYVLSP